ncbi:MAG: glycosyltransferase [Candidatus Hydrogenedentes bacterium]|nr:glycosyltransferase [Candidatus Hydrogenedentota bacterium]
MLIHNFLSPYRVPLFAELARRFDLDVWILGDIRSVREWPSEAPDAGFRYRVLPHVTIPLGSRYNVVLINYTLPSELARHKPDAIVFCAWDTPAAFYTAWHAKKSRTPFILWSGSTAAEDTMLRRLTRPLVTGLVRRADAFLAYGSRARDYLVSLGADPDRMHLAYNTVETEAFARLSRITSETREALRARLGIATKRVLLYCGNLLELKGVGDLLIAFARFAKEHSAVTLLLVGSGRDEPRYRRFVQEEGLAHRVVFAGFVARDDLPRYYALADLLILPSRSEIWGLVINEALACGLPVLATDVCGATPDLVQEGMNGYVVPARHPDALCEALRRHFDTCMDCEAMRDSARRSIEPFKLARAADAFEAAVTQARECV